MSMEIEAGDAQRALTWLQSLHVVSDDPQTFQVSIDNMAKQYGEILVDLGVAEWHRIYCPKTKQLQEKDLPSDAKLMQEVHTDVIRTGRQIYFLAPSGEPPDADASDPTSAFSEHIRRIERALYVFGVTNASISYMQGFNELIMPLYYVATKGIAADLDTCEAVSFFALQRLITATGVGELYNMKERQANVVLTKMCEFEHLLREHLPRLAEDLQSHGISPMHYAYRWFTLLFGQEYDIPSLLVLWDEMMSHKADIMEFAYYIGIAQLKVLEVDILGTDVLSKKMELLQKFRIDSVRRVIEDAKTMWERHNKAPSAKRRVKTSKWKRVKTYS